MSTGKKEGDWVRIYPLTEYQLGYLRRLFIDEQIANAPKLKVERIAFSAERAMVVDYIKDGQLITDMITKEDNAETRKFEYPKWPFSKEKN